MRYGRGFAGGAEKTMHQSSILDRFSEYALYRNMEERPQRVK